MRADKYLCFILTAACVFSGCGSSVPHPTTFPMQTQRKMQAARHWDLLAEDVAGQVKKCIAERKDLMVKPVYVVPKEETPFGEIFHDILISKLVGGGVVVTRAEKDVMKMEYTVKLLEHSDRDYSILPLKFTALGAGIMVARKVSDWTLDKLLPIGVGAGLLADIGMSRHAGKLPHKEVIITTSLIFGDYYFMHQTDIYYINDPDADHYVKEAGQRAVNAAESETTINVAEDPQKETTLQKNDREDAPESKNAGVKRRKFNVVD